MWNTRLLCRYSVHCFCQLLRFSFCRCGGNYDSAPGLAEEYKESNGDLFGYQFACGAGFKLKPNAFSITATAAGATDANMKSTCCDVDYPVCENTDGTAPAMTTEGIIYCKCGTVKKCDGMLNKISYFSFVCLFM